VEVAHRFSRYGFVFPSRFNRTCTSEFLDLPASLVKHCSSITGNQSLDPSSPCARLTCRNLLLGGDDPQLYDIATNFSSRYSPGFLPRDAVLLRSASLYCSNTFRLICCRLVVEWSLSLCLPVYLRRIFVSATCCMVHATSIDVCLSVCNVDGL